MAGSSRNREGARGSRCARWRPTPSGALASGIGAHARFFTRFGALVTNQRPQRLSECMEYRRIIVPATSRVIAAVALALGCSSDPPDGNSSTTGGAGGAAGSGQATGGGAGISGVAGDGPDVGEPIAPAFNPTPPLPLTAR